jgi:uncharacterized protein YehS (DUF1456 family)
MNNNDILRRLRYALKLSDARLVKIFARVDFDLNEADARALLGKEDEEGTVICLDDLMAVFLDGLILELRGPSKDGRPPHREPSTLTNNTILKKIRIALKLHEEDMLAILKLGEQPMSKSEITALFRKPGHKHYRACGDQVVRAFLRGLTQRLRPSD